MLDYAIKYSEEDINNNIIENDYPYLHFNNYKALRLVNFKTDEWTNIQRVSIDEDKNILGFLEAEVCLYQKRVNSLFLVRFNNNTVTEHQKLIFKEDLEKFIDDLANNKQLEVILFSSIVDNPANKTYKKWINKYGGYVNIIKNYCTLKDGNRYDIYEYIIDKSLVGI